MTTKTTNLTHAEATEYMRDAARRGDHAQVEYPSRDATGDHWIHTRCWLDGDGDLVQVHPTDWRWPPIHAPRDVRYSIIDPAVLAEESKRAHEQENDQ
jgi:hypothetical protein